MGRHHKFIEKHLLKRSLLSYLLYPLSLCYMAIQVHRRRRGYTPLFRPKTKIISIGNIVCGGSGKTPTTIALARLLTHLGYQVAISHRGYKGEYEFSTSLISDASGLLAHAGQAGDEAYLIASRLKGIPVVVGRDRRAAIQLLEKSYPHLDVIILDDSFQHLKVHHDLDIITFSEEVRLGNGYLLPAGYLREPLQSISTEHLVLINSKRGDPAAIRSLREQISPHSQNIYLAELSLSGFYAPDGTAIPAERIRKSGCILVCGIAFPQSFSEMLRKEGIRPVEEYHYPDHYSYQNPAQIAMLIEKLDTGRADYLVTTEKDASKLQRYPELINRMAIAGLELIFAQEEDFSRALISRLGRPDA